MEAQRLDCKYGRKECNFPPNFWALYMVLVRLESGFEDKPAHWFKSKKSCFRVWQALAVLEEILIGRNADDQLGLPGGSERLRQLCKKFTNGSNIYHSSTHAEFARLFQTHLTNDAFGTAANKSLQLELKKHYFFWKGIVQKEGGEVHDDCALTKRLIENTWPLIYGKAEMNETLLQEWRAQPVPGRCAGGVVNGKRQCQESFPLSKLAAKNTVPAEGQYSRGALAGRQNQQCQTPYLHIQQAEARHYQQPLVPGAAAQGSGQRSGQTLKQRQQQERVVRCVNANEAEPPMLCRPADVEGSFSASPTKIYETQQQLYELQQRIVELERRQHPMKSPEDAWGNFANPDLQVQHGHSCCVRPVGANEPTEMMQKEVCLGTNSLQTHGMPPRQHSIHYHFTTPSCPQQQQQMLMHSLQQPVPISDIGGSQCHVQHTRRSQMGVPFGFFEEQGAQNMSLIKHTEPVYQQQQHCSQASGLVMEGGQAFAPEQQQQHCSQASGLVMEGGQAFAPEQGCDAAKKRCAIDCRHGRPTLLNSDCDGSEFSMQSSLMDADTPLVGGNDLLGTKERGVGPAGSEQQMSQQTWGGVGQKGELIPYYPEVALPAAFPPREDCTSAALLAPELPTNCTAANWSFYGGDPEAKIVMADFSKTPVGTSIHAGAERYLLKLMQRHDICVLCKNVTNVGLQDVYNSLHSEFPTSRDDLYDTFRVYRRKEEPGTQVWEENGEAVLAKVVDFVEYSERLGMGEHATVEYVLDGKEGEKRTLNSANEAIYMLDVDMKRMNILNNKYKDGFKLKKLLSGGAWCFTREVSKP